MAEAERYVKSVFIIHVGGTRWVTSSTDNNMNRHDRITLTVECIRTCLFFYVYLMWKYNAAYDQYSPFFDVVDFQVEAARERQVQRGRVHYCDQAVHSRHQAGAGEPNLLAEPGSGLDHDGTVRRR